MNPDDRLTRYLSAQAEGIDLPPADTGSVVRRGARRRARRRAGFVGGLAVVGVLATTLAVRDPGADQQVSLQAAPNVAASSYDWSSVEPTSGLGYGNRTAQLADGTVFGISTAPGPYDPDDPETWLPSTLYRSTDGAEWTSVSLPAGARSADLTGAGDTLFSLGTAPAGGLVLSSSTDGASSWSSMELGPEIAQLKARHGDRIRVGAAQVAAADASRVVATVSVSTNEDVSVYRPELGYETHTWQWDETGVDVFELRDETECVEAAGVRSSEEEREEDATRSRPAGCDAEAVRADGSPGDPVASFTYEELGIDGELRDHFGGRPYTYVSQDGESFELVDLGLAAGTDEWLSPAFPLATPDGFRMAVGRVGRVDSAGAVRETTILRSQDGRSWDVTATIPGEVQHVGLLGDRPAVSTWTTDGGPTVQVEQADGVWSSIDLAGAIATPDGHESWLNEVAFGPLGLAAVVHTIAEGGDGDTVAHVVHTSDGATLEVLALDEVVGNVGGMAGAVVTADAIVVRFTEPTDDDASTPPTQTVLVGTPTA